MNSSTDFFVLARTPGAGTIAMNQRDKVPALVELTF